MKFLEFLLGLVLLLKPLPSTGEQTGQFIHLSASGVDWQENKIGSVPGISTSYAYYMNFADFPNPKNPVAGSEAIVSISVSSTGDTDVPIHYSSS